GLGTRQHGYRYRTPCAENHGNPEKLLLHDRDRPNLLGFNANHDYRTRRRVKRLLLFWKVSFYPGRRRFSGGPGRFRTCEWGADKESAPVFDGTPVLPVPSWSYLRRYVTAMRKALSGCAGGYQRVRAHAEHTSIHDRSRPVARTVVANSGPCLVPR